MHPPLYGKDNYKSITMWQADSPSISLSLYSNPFKHPGAKKSEVEVTKITEFPRPLWKSKAGRGDPRVPLPRGQSWPHPTQVPAGQQPRALHQNTQELGLLLWGRKGTTKWKKTAIGRKWGFAISTAHGTGCFITIFLTEASKCGLSKNSAFLLSLTIAHLCFKI